MSGSKFAIFAPSCIQLRTVFAIRYDECFLLLLGAYDIIPIRSAQILDEMTSHAGTMNNSNSSNALTQII
jgi:hypothetical protein